MPRQAIGERPMTEAERSARRRRRQADKVQAWHAALAEIAAKPLSAEAPDADHRAAYDRVVALARTAL